MVHKESVKDDKGRYHVAYTATVRITLTRSGAYRGAFYRYHCICCHCCTPCQSNIRPLIFPQWNFIEDCGAGDAIDRSLGTASGHAIKGAITDAMKRAGEL